MNESIFTNNHSKFYVLTLAIIFALVSIPATSSAQTAIRDMTHDQLFKELARMDSILFRASFVDFDHETLSKILADDVEFYHDKGGLVSSEKSQMVESAKKRKGKTPQDIRELIKGSLEVYPLYNFGAIQKGEHRFYELQEDQTYLLYEVAKFTHLWQRKDDGSWILKRILSYDHQPIDPIRE